MTPEEFFRAASAAAAAEEPYDVEAGLARFLDWLTHMAPDNWDTLTPEEQDEHVRMLHHLDP